MAEKKRKSKKKNLGLKIFLGVMSALILVIGGYVYSVYRNLNYTNDAIYTPVQTQNLRDSAVDLKNQDSISILLLGIDNGTEDRTEEGRSDTMVVVTINPKTQRTTFVSIPRDTFSEIVGNNSYDKINHAYWYGGAEMSINTVQKLLGIPIDYYASVNMEGIQQIVDVLGGIEVQSPLAFTIGEYTFTEGTNQLDGAAALAFSRMRSDDPEQDTGRQERQRIVLAAISKKVLSRETLQNYQDILHSLSVNMNTNFQASDYIALQKYGYVDAISNIQQDHLGGVGGLRDDIYYSFVDGAELARVQDLLQAELDLK